MPHDLSPASASPSARLLEAHQGLSQLSRSADHINADDINTDDMSGLLLLLDLHGCIQFSNPAVQAALGYRRGALERQDALTFVHQEDQAALRRSIGVLGSQRRVTLPRFRVRRERGQWCEFSGHALMLGRSSRSPGDPARLPPLLLVQLHSSPPDLRMQAVRRVSAALSEAYTVPAVVEVMLNTGLSAAHADAGSVCLLTEDAAALDLMGSAGYAEESASPWTRIPLSLATPVTEAVQTLQPIFLNDGEFQVRFPQIYSLHAPNFASAAVLPLFVGQRLLGAYTLSFRHNRLLAQGEREFLQVVADLCAPALDRAHLQAQVQRQQQEVQRQQDWFSAVTHHSSDIVTVLDSQAIIQYQSGSVERILGYQPFELIGQHVFDLVHPDDYLHPGDRERSWATLEGAQPGAAPLTLTLRFRHRRGHWVWLESVTTDLRHHPQARGFLINSRDVTAREEARIARQESMAALERSERDLRRLADNASDLIRQYSGDGQIEYVSPSVYELLGYRPEELLRPSDPMVLIHGDDQPLMREAFLRRFAADEEVTGGGQEAQKFEYRIRRKDGSYLWVETSFKLVRHPGTRQVTAFITTSRDIQQRKQVELALLSQVNRYRQLLDFTVSLEELRGPLDLTREALHKCLDLTEYDYGYAFNYTGHQLALSLHAGSASPQITACIEELWRAPFAADIWQALGQHRAFFVTESETVLDPPETLPRLYLRSFCVIPVTQGGELSGLLVFGTDQVASPSSETRRLLENVAARLSRALERNDHLEQLNCSREETLRALGLALEYRDYETKGHTDRVVSLTEQLGERLGFGGSQLDALRWGAFLHDTGKVAIPDAILLKPGKLLPDEWSVIKRHPTIGFEMLQHIPSLPPTTLEVVLYHQERWNGSGYPLGLRGEAIPLAARIFAVIDVYDALTSARPYKHAWTHAEAVEQLRREAGSLLDVQVVDAFLKLFDPGRE